MDGTLKEYTLSRAAFVVRSLAHGEQQTNFDAMFADAQTSTGWHGILISAMRPTYMPGG